MTLRSFSAKVSPYFKSPARDSEKFDQTSVDTLFHHYPCLYRPQKACGTCQTFSRDSSRLKLLSDIFFVNFDLGLVELMGVSFVWKH